MKKWLKKYDDTVHTGDDGMTDAEWRIAFSWAVTGFIIGLLAGFFLSALFL